MTTTKWHKFLEVCEAATKGPWLAPHKSQNDVIWLDLEDLVSCGSAHYYKDRKFIAHSRTLAPEAARIALAVEEHRDYWLARPRRCGAQDAIRLLDAILAGEGPKDDS